jgi:phage FluMu protein Com
MIRPIVGYNRLMMKTELSCTACGCYLPLEWISNSIEYACPTCGSMRKLVNIAIEEDAALTIHETIKGKTKNPSFSSKEKVRTEFFVGDDLRKRDGVWMKKDRLIDRDKNFYRETVTDPRSGEIVHHIEEPLSAHVGHGLAKRACFSVSDDGQAPVKPEPKH